MILINRWPTEVSNPAADLLSKIALPISFTEILFFTLDVTDIQYLQIRMANRD